MCVGGAGLARADERRFALRVLEGVLGGTSSSRLFQEVRERRGLAYSVFAFSNLYAHTGEIGMYVGTRPDNVSEALAVVAAELERCVADPASEEELVRSRENLKGRIVLAHGVDRCAHEPPRRLAAERDADPIGRRDDRAGRHGRAGRGARARR